MVDEQAGVLFPTDGEGRRSTSAFGRVVTAAALQHVDPVGARAALAETNWRSDYLLHLRRLLEAGLLDRSAAVRIARDGLEAVHAGLRYRAAGGEEVGLSDVVAAGEPGLSTASRAGSGTAERELTLPYRGQRLAGDALRRQLDRWAADGIVEPGCAAAVHTVLSNPDWLDTSDHTVVVLGAGSEMGPLQSLLRWGGTVVALDLPRRALWDGVLERTQGLAGRLRFPVRNDAEPHDHAAAGADLVLDLPQVAGWLAAELSGPVVVGNYVYADGAANVGVCAAADRLCELVLDGSPEASLAFLATPTDVFGVPADAVEQSVQAYRSRPRRTALLRTPLKVVSGGRLMARNYLPGADPGVADALVTQQGPNYALAKRLQRFRATAARDAGRQVSLNVAPPTRTRSVLKNRGLAAAYAGAHRFGIEVFDPSTSNTLMAALLVHDLRAAPGPLAHPWQDEAREAAHGGLWRGPYDPRSALGLAVLLGFGSTRT